MNSYPANPFTPGPGIPVHLTGVRNETWSLPHDVRFQLGSPAPARLDGWLSERQAMASGVPVRRPTDGLGGYWAMRVGLPMTSLALAKLALNPLPIAPVSQQIVRVGALARALRKTDALIRLQQLPASSLR
jgi:hypothetical protein